MMQHPVDIILWIIPNIQCGECGETEVYIAHNLYRMSHGKLYFKHEMLNGFTHYCTIGFL